MSAIGGQGESPEFWKPIGRVLTTHVAMLHDVGLIDDDAISTLLAAIERARDAEPEPAPLLRLIGQFDERLDALLPAGLSGVARVGRGSVDVAAAVARLVLRDELRAIAASANELRSQLIALAEQHVTTLMPTYLDGSVAQPATLGQMLASIVSQLGRAMDRLEAAYVLTNRSPLGSGSGASTGMPIDRERLVDLLGFDSLIEGTLDAVSATDYFSAVVDAVEALLLPVRRWLADLIAWSIIEPGPFRFSETCSETDAANPQTGPLAGVSRLLADIVSITGQTTSVRSMVAVTPFGPVTGGLDALLLISRETLRAGIELIELTAMMIGDGFQINRALLANRAGKGLSTASDLGDFLMIEEQIPPGSARQIAALTVARAREQGLEASGITVEMIDVAALIVIGREIKVEFEAISRYLAPRRFIERRSVIGGPAPSSVRSLVEGERAGLARDAAWWSSAAERIASADKTMKDIENEAGASAPG